MTKENQTIEEMVNKLHEFDKYVGRKIFHNKSNSYYVITGFHFWEATMGIVFVYETLHHTPVSFVRPIAELFDNRFTLK